MKRRSTEQVILSINTLKDAIQNPTISKNRAKLIFLCVDFGVFPFKIFCCNTKPTRVD